MSDHQRIAPEVAQAMMDAATPGPLRTTAAPIVALRLAAPDLAHTVVLQAAEIAALRADLTVAVSDLRAVQAYRVEAEQKVTGLSRTLGDVHTALGNGADERAWPPGKSSAEAVAALRAELSAARVGMVTAEAHARAVREAFSEVGVWMSRWHDTAESAEDFAVSRTRLDLIATITATGIPEARAVALADGAE